MNDYDFKSSICTSIDQSEKLMALGLKSDTADMRIVKDRANDDPVMFPAEQCDDHGIPAWTLGRLMELMPYSIEMHQAIWCLQISRGFVRYAMDGKEKSYIGFFQRPNTYDAVVDCMEWLIKDGHFETEYLETIHNA